MLACLPEEVPEPELIRPVLVRPVQTVSATQERTFPSRAHASIESTLSFKVAGSIKEVHVGVGESVRRGKAIAALDVDDLSLELRRAEAQFAEASARDAVARAEFERSKRLFENNAASENQLDAAKTTAASATAGLEVQAQAVALAKSQLGYAELRAPMDGRIASVECEVGENVKVGDTIATLNSGGRPEVRFTVPGHLIGSIEPGHPATVRFAALAESIFPAEVVEVGVRSGRAAFPVTARLLNIDERIRSGMVGETTVRFSRREMGGADNLVVPAYAVAEDADGRFVYVAVDGPEPLPDGTTIAVVERRDVKTAGITVEGLEITEGLSIGDRVVTAGLRFVEPGMSVRAMTR